MKFGCCGPLDQAEAMKAAGFDYIEVNVQQVLRGQEDDATWQPPAEPALPIEAANCLVPGSLPIVGPDRDLDALAAYMDRVTARAAQLGIARMVFGSGGARKRPEEVGEIEAFDQIVAFARLAGEAATKHGVVVVIEHLNRGETNTLNSLADALKVAHRVDMPSVAMLVDSYHYGLEQEDDAALLSLSGKLEHAHAAEPVGRVPPGTHGQPGRADDAFDFVHFFALLKKIGYDQRVSFEGKWPTDLATDGPACVRAMREAWAAADAEMID